MVEALSESELLRKELAASQARIAKLKVFVSRAGNAWAILGDQPTSEKPFQPSPKAALKAYVVLGESLVALESNDVQPLP